MIVKAHMHVLGERLKVTDLDGNVLFDMPLAEVDAESVETLKGNMQGLVGEFHAEYENGTLVLKRPVRQQ